MGYELTRFIGEIDGEFVCSMCKLVLENPVQIPCEHSFCYECIKRRIAIERTCPVDLIPITLNGTVSVFKPPSTTFRNRLYKLNITCDFQSVGCSKIMMLENLLDHIKSCDYNADAELVCDKGCNLTVTRRDYLTNSCSLHLKRENVKLGHHLSFQRKRFEGLANCLYDRIKTLTDEVNRHCTQKLQLENVIIRQQQAISAQKLKTESVIRRQQEFTAQKQQLENVIRRQHQEITQLSRSRVSNTAPLKWQICHNMNVDDTNILKIDDYNASTFAFVQSYYPLQPAKPHFEIQLSNSTENSSVQRNLIWIGLTRKGQRIVRNPEEGSIACIWNGRIQANEERVEYNVARWEDGDRIKLGIKFPNSFAIEGNYMAVLCVHKNEKSLFEKRIGVPKDGLFPTVCIYGRDAKVAYICCS